MIRVCPMRDARCPHGVDCPYVGDGPYGYPCKEGYNQVAARAERDRVMSTPEPLPIAFERASAENEGEPVAWRSRRRGSDDDWDLFFTKPAPRSDYEDQPLYARPDPAVERLQRELDEARALLTCDHSLPHDWTLQQVIEGRLDDINKLKWQVRDTCIRAEAAEASLVKAREALTKALELAELAEELTGNQADDEFVWSLHALFKQTLADLKAGDQP